jgi:hypothetical protein
MPDTRVKDPQRQAAARARWGPPKTIRLDQLEPSIAAAVRALIAADASAKEKAGSEDQTPEPAGVDGGTRDAASTN